jgi:MOSC domain-containing protein YiiM
MSSPPASGTSESAKLDSESVGDPSRFLPLDRLVETFDTLPPAPTSRGRVALVTRRGEGGLREVLERVRITPEDGVPGDAWGRKAPRDLESQITVMQRDVAELLANGQPIVLAGDNLFVDLDLSDAHLPAGTRLRMGGATVLVTPKPHNGCKKFKARFGEDALRFVSQPARRAKNLRGIHVRVIEPGDVAPGDAIDVVP